MALVTESINLLITSHPPHQINFIFHFPVYASLFCAPALPASGVTIDAAFTAAVWGINGEVVLTDR